MKSKPKATRKPGLINKIKGYDNGGVIDPNMAGYQKDLTSGLTKNKFITSQNAGYTANGLNSLVDLGSGIAGYNKANNIQKDPNNPQYIQQDKNANLGSGIGSAAGTGLGIGISALTGGLATPLIPAFTALGKLGGKAIGNIFDNKNSESQLVSDKNTATQNQLDADNKAKFQSNLANQLSSRNTYKNGGKVKGYGNGGRITPAEWDAQNLKAGYALHPKQVNQGTVNNGYNNYYDPNKFTPEYNADGILKWSKNDDPNYNFETGKESPVIQYVPPMSERMINSAANMNDTRNSIIKNNISFSNGGKVVGKGTGTSDSIKAKVKVGSFIIPAKNAAKAKAIKEEFLEKDPNAKAELNDKNGVDIRISHGEYVFSPEEKAELEQHGIDIASLAPDTEHSEKEMNKGGLTPEKARLILKDGTIRGKSISDKQRKYFGWISDGHKCGGIVGEYSEGGTIKINPAHKGIFTAWAKEHNMSVKQAADHVMANTDKFSPHVVKMAGFAKNIAGLKKGGNVKGYVDGGDISDSNDPFKAARERLIKSSREGDLKEKDALETEYKALKAKAASGNPVDKFTYQKRLPEIGRRIQQINQKHGLTPDNTPSDIPTKTGKQLSEITGSPKTSITGSGLSNKLASKPAVNITPDTIIPTNAANSLKNTMANQNVDNAIVPPVSGLANKATPYKYNTNAIDEAGQTQAEINSRLAETAPPTTPNYGSRIGSGLSTLLNYGIPIAQAGLGYKYLQQSGQRPVDSIDPNYQTVLNNANTRASYGFTPEEQTLLNNQNAGLTESQRFAARNYSGGSAGNAYNMERAAINDSYGRGLSNAVANRQLQLGKRNDANEIALKKVELSRRLFNDKLAGWQQQQSTGANLLGVGLSNLVGANRYEQEKRSIADQNAASSNWLNSLPQ